MKTRFLPALLPALLFVCGAAAPPADLHDADALYADLGAQVEQAYVATLARYDAAQAAMPSDAGLAVARCQFIGNFSGAEDVLWVKRTEKDLDACQARLGTGWPGAREVRIYQFEQAGEEGLEDGEHLWEDARTWPAPLRRRIAYALYQGYEGEKEDEYALAGARLGDERLIAPSIGVLRRRGDEQGAASLAATAPVATTVDREQSRLRALGKLQDKQAAARELRRAREAGLAIDKDVQLDVALAAGDLATADAVSRASTGTTDKAMAAGRFSLSLARHRIGDAAALVDVGDDAEVWIPRYARLLHVAPVALLSPSLFVPFAALAACLLAFALLPGLALFPFHYRGMVRRLRGRPATPLFEGVGLRHAWIGAAMGMLVPFLAIFAFFPDSVGAILSDDGKLGFVDDAVGSVALLVALAALLPRFGRKHLLGTTIGLRRTLLLVLGAWAAVAATWFLIAVFHKLTGAGFQPTDQTRAVQALADEGLQRYGVAGVLATLAVLTPIVEELLFRGLLLGGLSRHIGFWWANVLQASLFTAMHVDAPRIPGYFVLGLASGWLVRRTGSLWPAVLLHALNNAMATLF